MGEEGYERVFGKQVVKLKRLGVDGQVLDKSGIMFNVSLNAILEFDLDDSSQPGRGEWVLSSPSKLTGFRAKLTPAS